MLFYDFEVFSHDWLVVVMDSDTESETVIINSWEELNDLYQQNINNIWAGFNSNHYDQWIMKAIIALGNENGTDVSVRVAKRMNDHIIVEHKEGWMFSNVLRNVQLNNYDVMPNPPIGLKTLEGFLGSDIKETSVPFNIGRKLNDQELEETIRYCRHDVEQAIKVFIQNIADFEANFAIVKAFDLPLHHIGDTAARITATVLECTKHEFKDEFEYFFFPCLRLTKYREVQGWFEGKRDEARILELWREDDFTKGIWYRSQNLTLDVAGVPHTFGFGGLHGAPKDPVHLTGQILHVDVNNYYPSMLVAYDLVTRSASNDNYAKIYRTRKDLKYKQTHAKTKEEAKQFKKAQLPYKKMLNALSGSMKDATNPAFDPRNNNCMCINGQLMLLDLIEHLEAVPGFELIQSNTDGLIIRVPDTDEAFDAVDDICWEWEKRCSTDKCGIRLELDNIKEIWQKDVNNYVWITEDGNVRRIGKYVKELSPIDNDLPILNRALVEYMIHGIPVEETINGCDELIQFQKIVKLSDKYTHVEHEHGGFIERRSGVRVIKTWKEYTDTVRYDYKSYRVFASSDPGDGRILKCGGKRGKPEKFADTPDHCFIDNDDITGSGCPAKLDRQWYIDFAKKRLKHFGIEEGDIMNTTINTPPPDIGIEDQNITINYHHGHMSIRLNTFFPCNQTDFKKLLKLIEQDWEHADEILMHMQKFLPAKIELEKFSNNTKAYLDRLRRNYNTLIDYCVKR